MIVRRGTTPQAVKRDLARPRIVSETPRERHSERLPWQTAALLIAILSVAAWIGLAYIFCWLLHL
jgi:type VI protein secretion system component VasF